MAKKHKSFPTEALQTDVVIVGGGMNGLSLACCLGRLGIETVIIDRENHTDMLKASFDGRTTAIAQGMKRMLKTLGIWQHIDAEATPILDIKIRDGNSPMVLHFDHKMAGTEPMGYIVENHIIRQALAKTLKEYPSVTLLDQAQATGIERTTDKIVVNTPTSSISANLLAGADGRRSFVRKWAKIRTKSWAYGQTALVFLVSHSKDHQNWAHECFFPQGPLAFLPMTGNKSQVVWSLEGENAEIALKNGKKQLINQLQAQFGNDLGDLTLESDPVGYPLAFNHAYDYVAERIVLIGDAAHGLHPIAGQGLNVGMRDVAALAEMIADQQPTDLGNHFFLQSYNKARKPDVMSFAAATDGLNRLFGVKSRTISLPRKLGIGLVGKIPPLRDFFIRQAMGTGVHTPRLFKGQAL